MPELPEVETVRRGLERTVVGKTIASVEIHMPKIFPVESSAIDAYLVGATIMSVKRRAKVILVQLSNNYALAIHLKMTGQIIVVNGKPLTVNGGGQSVYGSPFTVHPDLIAGHPEKSYEQPLPHKHTHVIITFTDGTVLYFNDLRKFGWIRLLSSSNVAGSEVVKGLQSLEDFLLTLKHGPEPLSDEFTVEHLYAQAKKRAISIKTFLLDQSVVAGVGNIYADETLFEATIKPTRKARSLTRTETERLHAAIRHVLALGIKHGGTTLNTYRNVEGTAGKMREHLKVYGRKGQPCVICQTPIKRIKIGQRSSHYCPNCQR